MFEILEVSAESTKIRRYLKIPEDGIRTDFMITIPFQFLDPIPMLKLYQREASRIQRWSYNRAYKEGLDWKQIEDLSIETWFDKSLTRAQIKKGYSTYLSCQETGCKHPIFGSKELFYRRKRGLISRDEWRDARLSPVVMDGEANHSGNRKFELDFINNRQVVFKPSKKYRIVIPLHNTSKGHRKLLERLETLANQKKIAFTIELTYKGISITFDESKLYNTDYQSIPNRILALDLNPNYIGLSVSESGKVVRSETINLNKLKDSNRRNYIFLVSKYISKLANHYHVAKVAFEDLNIKPENKKKGKSYNKLVNNSWIRNDLISNLKKRLNLLGIPFKEVYCAYSSLIGNLTYSNYPDPIAASLEIARRSTKGYKDPDRVFPSWNPEVLPTRWKEMVATSGLQNWIELYRDLKRTRTQFRVGLNSINKDRIKFLKLLSYQIPISRHLVTP